jgi:hypothetical protein
MAFGELELELIQQTVGSGVNGDAHRISRIRCGGHILSKGMT